MSAHLQGNSIVHNWRPWVAAIAGRMTTLHEALGWPPLAAPLPLASSDPWQRTRWLLRRSLVAQECCHNVRSPVALWNGIHHSACPQQATWGRLCGALTLAEAVAALSAHSLRPTLSFVSWNVRWLTDPFSDQGTRKRAVIQGHLALGRPVLLQETHWSIATYERLMGSFPDAQVFATRGGS